MKKKTINTILVLVLVVVHIILVEEYLKIKVGYQKMHESFNVEQASYLKLIESLLLDIDTLNPTNVKMLSFLLSECDRIKYPVRSKKIREVSMKIQKNEKDRAELEQEYIILTGDCFKIKKEK